MEAVMTAITGAGTTLIGHVGVAAGAGIGVAVVVLGIRRAWSAFKSMSS